MVNRWVLTTEPPSLHRRRWNKPPPAWNGQMSDVLRVLHVEDSVSDAALTERFLTRAGYDVYSERVVNAQEMLAALARQPWDIIIANYHLHEFDASSALSL